MSQKNHSFVVSVMFRDRVGIVADVAGVLHRLGGNLADVSQTVLCGYFTMILMADMPAKVTEEELRQAFADTKSLAGAVIGIMPYEDGMVNQDAAIAAPQNAPQNRYILTANGPDQPGLVATFAGYLRERNINIVDLTSCITADGEYTMIWLIDIPEDLEVGKLKHSMEISTAALNMKIAIRHQALFQCTNEI